jgi:hypothetical protein
MMSTSRKGDAQVRSFVLLYNGPTTSPGASHEGWPDWFQSIGDKLVDIGSPMANGFVVHSDGTTSDTAASFNGYSIIRAEGRDRPTRHARVPVGPSESVSRTRMPVARGACCKNHFFC